MRYPLKPTDQSITLPGPLRLFDIKESEVRRANDDIQHPFHNLWKGNGMVQPQFSEMRSPSTKSSIVDVHLGKLGWVQTAVAEVHGKQCNGMACGYPED